MRTSASRHFGTWALMGLALLMRAGVNSSTAAEARTLIHNAQQQAATWRFTTHRPPDDWIKPTDLAALQKLRQSRWSPERAWKWYAAVGPICGCNYLPRSAVNSTEMWQRESFDPRTIDQELGWAKRCGLNSVRVFVQYIVYEADPEGLIERMERFLEIADGHRISVMFILLDDCFKPEPKLGKQPDPVPGVHNSQWTSSPGERRKRRENWPALEKYVKQVVGHFARDQRVIVWDLYNEPKKESRPLVEAAFAWARSTSRRNR